jgi:hypothetical protein
MKETIGTILISLSLIVFFTTLIIGCFLIHWILGTLMLCLITFVSGIILLYYDDPPQW